MWSSAPVSRSSGKNLALGKRGATLLCAVWLLISLVQAQPSKLVSSRAGQGLHVNQIFFKGDGATMQVEIQTSAPITPQSQSLAAPDRIVIDFPGAIPAADLRSIKLNYGPLRAIRAGLFSANPPITRIVLDLDGPQRYQIVASENAVTLKFQLASKTAETSTAIASTDGVAASGNTASEASPAVQAAPPPPPVTVSFQQGLLQIHAKRVTLAEVLFEVQKQTGAEIPIPSGAEQEIVAADLGPAPARDVLSALLSGSRYNFVFIDNERDHSLQKAILTLR